MVLRRAGELRRQTMRKRSRCTAHRCTAYASACHRAAAGDGRYGAGLPGAARQARSGRGRWTCTVAPGVGWLTIAGARETLMRARGSPSKPPSSCLARPPSALSPGGDAVACGTRSLIVDLQSSTRVRQVPLRPDSMRPRCARWTKPTAVW